MAKKPPPPNVRFAILTGDHGALSRMGRHGAMMKKVYKEEDLAWERARSKRKTQQMLREAEFMALQAHEHICPID